MLTLGQATALFFVAFWIGVIVGFATCAFCVSARDSDKAYRGHVPPRPFPPRYRAQPDPLAGLSDADRALAAEHFVHVNRMGPVPFVDFVGERRPMKASRP